MPTQCAIANWAWSRSDCCGSPDFYWTHDCNTGNPPYGSNGSIQQILSHFGGINSVGQNSALSQATIAAEIDAGRPFLIAWYWYTGGGHALVGRGIEGNYLHYMDPLPGEGYKIGLYSAVVKDDNHNWGASLSLAASSSYRVLAGGDYAGDGRSDIAIFRPSTGRWSIRGHSTSYFGGAGDIPVPGDYNHDEITEIAVYRPTNGLWSIRGGARVYFGGASDIPVPADYNGDGHCDIAIWRPATGLWSVRGLTRVYHGTGSDKPVPADYNHDHRAEIAIFRDSIGLWSIRGVGRQYLGAAGDIPVPIDFNNEGYCRPAIFRPSTGKWSILWLGSFYFGGSLDQPVPAHYYGKSDGDYPAVFRPSDGRWAIYQQGGFRTYFGINGDLPVSR
jgi:hypothetical protein